MNHAVPQLVNDWAINVINYSGNHFENIELTAYSVNYWVNRQWNTQPLSQSTIELTTQSVIKSIIQTTIEPTVHTVNQWVNQSVNQSGLQLVNDWVNDAFIYSFSHSDNHWTDRFDRQLLNQPFSETFILHSVNGWVITQSVIQLILVNHTVINAVNDWPQ